MSDLVLNLYAPERRWLAACRAHFPLHATVVGTISWSAFSRLASLTDCSIAALTPRSGRELLRRAASLRAAMPDASFVLVTAHTDGESAFARGAPPDETVRPADAAWALWSAVQCACTRSLLRRASAAFERASHLPPVLRASFAHACRADPPARSVCELAVLVGRHRRTLWRHWRGLRDVAPPLRLDAILDWLLLLHATLRRARLGSWSTAALAIGVHRDRLARIAAVRMRARLHEITTDEYERVRATFAREVLSALLGPPASTPQGPEW